MKVKLFLIIIVLFIAVFQFVSTPHSFPPESEIQKKGCCSTHGGVCGCEGGRIKCCDGSFSPSCRCATDTDRNDIQ